MVLDLCLGGRLYDVLAMVRSSPLPFMHAGNEEEANNVDFFWFIGVPECCCSAHRKCQPFSHE